MQNKSFFKGNFRHGNINYRHVFLSCDFKLIHRWQTLREETYAPLPLETFYRPNVVTMLSVSSAKWEWLKWVLFLFEVLCSGDSLLQFWFGSTVYLLLSNDPRTIKLSSNREMISDVLSPRNKSSPRFLKEANVNSWLFQSATTDFSLASMSFSLVAAMQISYM